jgi:DNA-binding response OmpR family regulator
METTAKNILIIDDNLDICEVVQLILTKAGYKTKAMEYFVPFNKKEAPDLILLDIKMTNQDGTQICRELKSKKDTRSIPIIMFSASPDVEAEALEAGADDFIAKPFEIRDLLSKIEHAQAA